MGSRIITECEKLAGQEFELTVSCMRFKWNNTNFIISDTISSV